MKAYHSFDSLQLGPIHQFLSAKQSTTTMPRFTVIAEGLTMTRQTKYQLDELLGSIYADPPTILINAGGITIDFDHSG